MICFGGKIPNWLLILVMALTSIAAGAIWGLIPAIFKARWDTNETPVHPDAQLCSHPADQLLPWPAGKTPTAPTPWASSTRTPWTAGSPRLFGQTYGLNVLLAIVLMVAMYAYLNYTKQGYEIAVVGESQNTARYAGINMTKVYLRTMIISGAICGFAGFTAVAGADHTISTNTAGGRGFTAIIVAWLAKFNPFVMVLISFLLAFLEQRRGRDRLPLQPERLRRPDDRRASSCSSFWAVNSSSTTASCSAAMRRRVPRHESISSPCWQAAVTFGTVILFGALGEIITEKSGNLNLGIPGIMYLGGIAGLIGAFFYENGNAEPQPGGGHPDRPDLRHHRQRPGRTALQLSDHHPAGQPERHRPDPDHSSAAASPTSSAAASTSWPAAWVRSAWPPPPAASGPSPV